MLVANAGTPRPIVDRLNSKMKEIMSNADIQKRISNMGLIPVDPPSIADTEQFLQAEALKWKHILTEIGLAGSL